MTKSSFSGPAPYLCLLGLVAAIAVPMVLLQPEVVSQESGARPVGSDPRLSALEQRVASLEREVVLLATRLLGEGGSAGPLLVDGGLGDSGTGGSGESAEALAARLASLEALETQRQQAIAAEVAEDEAKDAAKQQRHLARRDLAQSIILDPSRTDAEKAAAWRELDDLDVDAWTDAVVLAMLDVATSPDPQIREDVWKGADADHESPLLIAPLLSALAADPQPKVREEAADALSRYLDEPGVRAALERAKDYDADMGVREEALKSLMDG